MFLFCFQERWLYIPTEKLHLMINRMMDVKNHLFEQIINQHLYMILFFSREIYNISITYLTKCQLLILPVKCCLKASYLHLSVLRLVCIIVTADTDASINV